MTLFPALPLLATNAGDDTDRQSGNMAAINGRVSIEFTTRYSLRSLLSCNFQASGKDSTLQPSLPSLTRDHPHLRFFTLCVTNRVIIIIIIIAIF